VHPFILRAAIILTMELITFLIDFILHVDR
jgi:hypothetical protein